MRLIRAGAVAALVCVVWVMTMQVAPVARAQDATVQVKTTDSARLRSGPGTTFTQLATIPFDTALTAVGRNADSSWIQVNYNNTVGWVTAALLRVTEGDLNSLPDASGNPPPPGPTPQEPTPVPPAAAPPGAVTGSNYNEINVRAGPGNTFAILGMLPAHSTVVLTGRWLANGSTWVRFDFNGQAGWAANWLLKITGTVSSLPDIKAQADAAAAAIPQICVTGAGVPMSAPYTPGPGIHPTLLFDFQGAAHPYASFVPTWKPPTRLATQLVGCIGEQQAIQVEYCAYEQDHSVYRYQYSRDVRMVVAQTGEVVGGASLWGEAPRNCLDIELFYNGAMTKSLYGSVMSSDQVIGWLRQWVEQQ